MMSDKLLEAIDRKKNPCVVGLDPQIDKIPQNLIRSDSLNHTAQAIREFNIQIIDSISDLVPAVKPQIAFYEQYGSE